MADHPPESVAAPGRSGEAHRRSARGQAAGSGVEILGTHGQPERHRPRGLPLDPKLSLVICFNVTARLSSITARNWLAPLAAIDENIDRSAQCGRVGDFVVSWSLTRKQLTHGPVD